MSHTLAKLQSKLTQINVDISPRSTKDELLEHARVARKTFTEEELSGKSKDDFLQQLIAR